MSPTRAFARAESVFGTVPSEWALDRLRDRLGPVVGGEWGDDPDAHDEGREIRVVRVADIRRLDVATEDLTIRRVKETKLPSRLIGKRTVLIEKSGGGERTPVGRAVLGRNLTGDAICSNFMAKTECGPTVSPAFVAYLFDAMYSSGINTPHIQQTTGIQNLRVFDYLDTKVGIPPVQEQDQIAAYLDESCAAIGDAINAKRRQLSTLDSLRKATITRAVTRGLHDRQPLTATGNVWLSQVPVGWTLVSLKRVSSIQTGLTLGKVYAGTLIERPYLRVANVQDGHLDLQEVTFIDVPLEVARGVELRAGDVLMTEGGDLDKLGRGTIWDGSIPDCLHQNHIFAVRSFKHKLLPDFLAYLTASQHGRDYFEATGKRTTNLASTNSTKLGLFPVPLPALKEQALICEFLSDRLAEIARIAGAIETQITLLLSYRASLIHECVTGRKRMTEVQRTRVRSHG